jgi:ferredoxin
MRLSVDPDKCDATGLCTEIAPELFELAGDVVHIRVASVDRAQWPAADEAVQSCPKLAITLEYEA